MIEEAGENWWLRSDGERSIEVTTAVVTHEEWSKPRKRKRKKEKPKKTFGFAREFDRKRGKR